MSDPQGNVLLTTTFGGVVPVKRSLLPTLLSDLQSFTNYPANLRSTLTISVGSDELQVIKDGAAQTTKFLPEVADVYAWLAERTGQTAESLHTLFDVTAPANSDEAKVSSELPGLITGFPVKESDPALERLRDDLIAKGGEIVKRFLEAREKIWKLERELSEQRQMDEKEMKAAELTTGVDEFDQKLTAVDQLAAEQKKIADKIASYGKLASSDLGEYSEKLREEIAQIRRQQISAGASTQAPAPVTDDEDNREKRGILAPFIPILGLLLLGLAGLGYLLSRDTRILFIGIPVSVLEIALGVAINLIAPKVVVQVADIPTSNSAVNTAPAAVTPVQGDANQLPMLEKFFVDKAWITALKSEMDRTKSSMTDRLGGEDYKQVKAVRDDIATQLEQLQLELEQYKKKEIPPEDYLRKRRELDIAKIEKSRLEADLKETGLYPDVDDYINELEAAPQGKENYVSALTDYQGIRIEGGQIEVQNSKEEWEKSKLPFSDLLAIFLWLKLGQWAKNPLKPMLLVDILSRLSEKARAAINARILELNSVGQLISITAQE